MATKKIAYSERDFLGIRNELLRITKEFYPDVIQSTNDGSIYSVFLDLNAGVTDNLHFHIDRSIQETVLHFAQQRSSLYNIARTYGLKIPGNRPSIAICDFSITVPAFGDKEDVRYCGIIKQGSQINGAGQIFETPYDINFASPYNTQGYPNQIKIPNFDSNGKLLNYTITKREVVVNGVTRIFKKVISPSDVKPFLQLFLPEKNVLGITSVIVKQGTNFTTLPTDQEFLDASLKYYEVDTLIEDKIFIADPTKPSDKPGIKVGKYITTSKKFITEYTPEGFFFMTFGGGTSTSEQTLENFVNQSITLDLNQYMNNLSLGETLQSNSTLYIQYRVGGGSSTNLGPNTISSIGTTFKLDINGPVPQINQNVKSTLKVNNITAAIGGADQPSLEEVRNYVAYNFASQNRAVTIKDYLAILQKMPGIFGAPAKVNIMELENKVMVMVLSYDPNGKLISSVSTTLMQNIATYLSNYRMMNDYVVVKSAEVIDLAIEADLTVDPGYNQSELVTNVIQKITTYFDATKMELGKTIFIGDLIKDIISLQGIYNIVNLRFFNRVGGQYSNNEISQPYIDSQTRQIDVTDQVLFFEPNQIPQIRFINKDIICRVKSPSNQIQ